MDNSFVDASANVVVAILTGCLFFLEWWRFQHDKKIADENRTTAEKNERVADESRAFERRAAKANYDLALFDKRMEVFLQMEQMLGAFIREGKPVYNEALALSYKTRNASFLFPNHVVEYIDDMVKRALDHHVHSEELEPLRNRAGLGQPLTDNERAEMEDHRQRKREIVSWFLGQATGQEMRRVFEPYLRLPERLE